ncbi:MULTISPECIES: lipopolysaccharide biosynthesis protein [unclassified Aerococcus]|uniref:lipopolysaccharide biosynthesis protein n=1 Tax=unclassified Aerococcus TaxID=2618060 RepID=UPI0008C2231F|nr:MULTISPECIES: polysaccharide biosynthesis C-terminal domain-containing protein [unclassified Aerococcus]MDK6368358.1 polysaccharide biosynthesis C-terminal domain-containing protein [Aerococcus sp. UMB9870]MDK6679440.1 polysaccharide biosynthesis C-terminal domain-containing protein [Aerococcus sp. UMB8608]MDK6687205.1 polysaccharide biosynthesis C-terminal domain-containing protein [Aerococcus sp. UMB8623]MDK6941096.1 polysaccharide biosynthesis C-terminal domain-containing protein [Aerococ
MNNISKLRINSITAIVNQLILILSGLILPRFFLSVYGSEINGFQASVGQFLSVINFLDLGVSSVVQSALYGPLVRKDHTKVNEIISAASSFFKKLALILLAYTIILCIIFPLITDSPLTDASSRFLILAMSISLFAQFYFGIVNQVFLTADQKNYIPLLANIVTTILNLVLSIILIQIGSSIVTVKFVSGFIFLLRPVYMSYYVNKNYNINSDVPFSKNTIPQKWNGMAQHIAWVIVESTDIVVLTIFSTLQNVSVYTVYNLVINGIKLLITSLTNGFKSFFGHLLAEEKLKELNQYFTVIEWQMHTISTLLFGLTASLIVPFVKVYTLGINDADYYAPIFAIILSTAQLVNCIRIPYNSLIISAGHFKETQTSAIIEALLNVVLSILLVKNFGLIGVAVGTLLAVSYRTIYFVIYLSKNILYRNVSIFIKQLFIDMLAFLLMIWIGSFFNIDIVNFLEWIKLAIVQGIIFTTIILGINYIFNRDQLMSYIHKLLKR